MTKLEELKMLLEGIDSLRKEIKEKLLYGNYKVRKEDKNKSDAQKIFLIFQRKEFSELYERLQGMYEMLGEDARKYIELLED